LNIRRAALVAVPLIAAITAGVAVASSSRTANSSAFTGTIKLMTIGPINAPGFSLPSIPVGAQVAVNEINAAGGVGGKKLVLLACNDKNDPNTAAACAVQAVKSKVVAVVGGFSIVAPPIIPVLERAGIPWVGPVPTGNYTSRILYLTGDSQPVAAISAGEILAKQGCKKTAVISDDTPPAVSGQVFFKTGIEFLGGGYAGAFTAAQNAPDWAPTVAAAQAAGADCLALGTGPAESGPVITAVRQTGKPMQMAALSGGLPDPVVAQLGSAADGVFVQSAYLPATSKLGVVQKLVKAAKALNPAAPYDAFLPGGYASVELVAYAAKGLKTVTPATLVKALNKVKNYNTGVGPVLNLTKPFPNPAFSRVFNTRQFIGTATDGKVNLTQVLDVRGALVSMK
jgi:ABC-type branched-subunit amino acid transport system substrate-binding protein